MRATPSKTARTIWSVVVASERLWNPPRTVWSSTGDRSPLSHGVNSTRPLPTGAAAAMAFMVSKSGARPRLSRTKVRQAPAVSCSSAIRYRPASPAGMDATFDVGAVFLNGTCPEIHEEVPM